MGGGGSTYDYGFRIYNPQIGKFLSVDPLTKSYLELTPYQFASNTPIWAVDWDGLEARVYLDVAVPIGHAFISVVDDNDVLHVYTYGQYGQGHPGTNSTATGVGGLVHLVGDAAMQYISDEFAHNPMRAYEIGESDKSKVMSHFQSVMEGKPEATPDQPVIQYALNDPTGRSNAVQTGNYSGITLGAGSGSLTDNCVTMVDKALQASGSNVIGGRTIPQAANGNLAFYSNFSLTTVTDVTDVVQQAVNSFNTSKSEPGKAIQIPLREPDYSSKKDNTNYVTPIPLK